MERDDAQPIVNRSVPTATVIPVLAYVDVIQAAEWLCAAFGFTERLRIGTHRVQLTLGTGAVIATEGGPDPSTGTLPHHSILVRVANVDQHHEHARAHGARITQPPTSFPYGERQYNATDLGGHQWTFSQSIADVDPASFGAISPSAASGDESV